MPKQKKWFWLAALVAAWLFDFLFWKKQTGISFLIWIVVLLGAGYLLAWSEGKKPGWRSILLTVLIAGFAAVIALRNEPMTRAVSIMLVFAGMLLLTATFLNGYWPWYRIRDYVVEGLKVIGIGFSGAVLLASGEKNVGDNTETEKSKRGHAWPIIRGILIALPILAVFAILLSAADQVFADWLKRILDLEKLPEYLFRLFYIIIIGGFLVGVYLAALYPRKQAQKPDPDQPWMRTFLGWTEGGIVLGAVNLLFIAFVIIQVRYLFGGTTNISETGYTYAQYARKGFGELVAVAVLSLLLYLVLSTITRLNSKPARTWFTVLSILLMANVMVILASSFQRLMLYENAYGFSQLRTYTHIFIYWLAALIVAVIVLELVKRRGRFAIALLVAAVGFGATLAILNVDGFIVNQNVARSKTGEKLDISYLNALTVDAVPQLLRHYQDPGTPANLIAGLGAALACREKTTEDPASLDWRAFSFSQAKAYRLLQENATSWSQFKPALVNNAWTISIDGDQIPCRVASGMD